MREKHAGRMDAAGSATTAGPVSVVERGEMAERVRAFDWETTSLGPIERWPPALRVVARAVLGSPFAMNLWCGPDLLLLYNDAYRRVLGAKHPAALGRPGPDVWAEVWPHLAPMIARIRAGGPPVYEEDTPLRIERAGAGGGAARREEGWFTFSLSAVRDDAGVIIAYLNVVSEVTGRVLTERRLRALHESLEMERSRLAQLFQKSPSILALLRGPAFVFEYVNEAYRQLVGRRELLGKPVSEAVPEVVDQGFLPLLEQVLATGEPFVGREMPIRLARTTGAPPEARYIDFVYQPLAEADGTRSGVLFHGTDVTDHVRTRSAVEQLMAAERAAREEAERARADAEAARAAAEQAAQAKADFLTTMSHEIRTPINAIVGYTQLLELGVPDPVTPAQLHQLDRIARSAQHLLGLVNDVLDVARMDAGELRVAHEHARVRPAVRAALAIARPLADQRGVGITIGRARAADVPAELDDAPYVGDENRVRQILVNLLSNAVKFTSAGGAVTVECGVVAHAAEAARVAGAGPWTYVSVADNGIGIAPEQHEAIFEPFVQVDVGLARSSTGTGLGLAISRRLARLMGGDLTVESQPGVGSTFTLWLPAAAVGEAGEAETPETRLKRAEFPGAGWRVRGLDEIGRAIRDESAAILAAYTARLRADPGIPIAKEMRRERLEDHAATLIADLAQSLVLVADAGEEAAALMRDGTTIQRIIAEQHGMRRRAQGWTEDALRRDHEILRDVLEQIVRTRASPSPDDASEGLHVLAWLTARAQTVGLAAYRQAAESGDAPVASP